MKKFISKSILEDISTPVFQAKTLQEAQTLITDYVNTRQIDKDDKESILSSTSECKTLAKLQSYICNSLLRFEGLSVNSYGKTEPFPAE